MIINYVDLLRQIEGKCNQYRRLYYFVSNCDALLVNWATVNREELTKLFETGDVPSIIAYLQRIEPIDTWTIRRLREYARSLAIQNYSRFTREDLLKEIKNEENRINRLYQKDGSTIQQPSGNGGNTARPSENPNQSERHDDGLDSASSRVVETSGRNNVEGVLGCL